LVLKLGMKSFLVTLPNKSHLKYAKGRKSGAAFRNDIITGARIANWDLSADIEIPSDHNLESGEINLKKAYKLNLWSSGTNQHVLCADFDDLPKGFKDFDELIEHLNWQYVNAVVTRSRRGRAKAFFVLELPPQVSMTNQIAELTLKEILEPALFEIVDRGGFWQTWLTPEIKANLQRRLHLLDPVIATIPTKENIPFRVAQGPLPLVLHNFISSGTKGTEFEKREKFVRILMATPLLRESFCISTKKCAAECAVEPMSISRWKRQLLEKGQLILINNQYFMGKQAKAFKAAGALLASLPPVPDKTTRHRLPPSTVIEDGDWNSALLYAVRFYSGDRDLVLQWFSQCSGHQLKDRRLQLERIIKSYARWKRNKNSNRAA